MRTSNKLSYLNETKELIKEALIEQGVEVSDTDTFRSYANKVKSISGAEDLSVELAEQDAAITELEEIANSLPDAGGITPEGTLYIITNGKYDVTDKAEVDVNVSVPADPIDPPVFGMTTFDENGEYNAEDYGVDGWSFVKVNVAGNDPNLIERTITDMDLSSGQFEILPTYTEPYNEDLDLSTIEVDKGEATYGFVYDSSTGRLEPTNKRSANTYSYGRINFDLPADSNTITITVYQSSESGYDYGFISKLDLPLNYNSNTSEPNAIYNSKGLSGEYTHTFTDVPAGEHFITFKYRKDGSGDTGLDTFAIVKINIDGSKLVSTDGLTKATIIKPDDLVSEHIMKDKEVFGIKGKLYVPEYQKTTTTVTDVLAGKKFITSTGSLAEGTIEEFVPEDSYTQNTVLPTGGKFVTKNILINVTPEVGVRDTMETYYEMKRTDFLRQQMGVVGLIDLPTDEEYLEQQTTVNNLIEKITGVAFNG